MQNSSNGRRSAKLVLVAGIASTALATALFAKEFREFSAPISAEIRSDPTLNTAFNDGCPILSPDGLSLFMATNRPGGLGGQDIWIARRESTTSGWGPPVNPGAPVNSAFDDFCPTPATGKRLFFVSRRDDPNGDIYVTRLHKDGYDVPTRFGPNVNSNSQEWSPSYYEDDDGNEVLVFSSTRAGTQDIYASRNFGPAQPIAELNTGFDDSRPNVRHDGREIVFDSTRPGTLGGPDLWIATRQSNTAAWSPPEHLAALSSAAPDTRASLSFDGTFLLFGSSRAGGEGGNDIYVSTRPRVTGR